MLLDFSFLTAPTITQVLHLKIEIRLKNIYDLCTYQMFYKCIYFFLPRFTSSSNRLAPVFPSRPVNVQRIHSGFKKTIISKYMKHFKVVLKKGVEMPLKIFYILGKYKIYISSTKDICILQTIMLVFCSHFLQFYSTSRTIWHKALIYSVYTYYYIILKYIQNLIICSLCPYVRRYSGVRP